MKHSEIVKAIFFINSESSFRLSGDDYSKIEWFSDWDKPTLKELQDALPLAIAAEQKLVADKIAAKESAISKLSALGLDLDEVTALLG